MRKIVEACNVLQIPPRNILIFENRYYLSWQYFSNLPPMNYKMPESFSFFFIPKLGLILIKEERQQWRSRTYLLLWFFLALLEFPLQAHMRTHLGSHKVTQARWVILTSTTTATNVHKWKTLSAVSQFNMSLPSQLLLLRF